MKNILEVGDIVEMKEGMAVEYDHFETIFYSAGRMEGTTPTIVYIGKVYDGRGDQWATRLRIRNAIKEIFNNESLPVEEDILRRFLAHQVKDREQPRHFVITAGLYQITNIETDGLARIVHCRTYKAIDHQSVIEFHFFQGSPSRGAMNHDNLVPTHFSG